MTADARYRINTPMVVHETFDDEVVVINLDSGCYYSLDGAGAVVWGRLEHGATLAEVVESVTQRFDGAPETIAAEIERLMAELKQEALVREDGAPNGQVAAAPAAPAGQRRPFAAPVLTKHTDMQDLLLLDPIHDVDDTGWPNARPQA